MAPEGKKIRYVGRHDKYIDRINKSKSTWKKGESKIVPDNIAQKYLNHADSFELITDGRVKATVLEDPPFKTNEDQKEENTEEVRFQIENMTTKKAVTAFITSQWDIGVNLPEKGNPLAKFKELANMYIDTLGLIENDV